MGPLRTRVGQWISLPAVRISVIYFVVSLLWVALSDAIAFALFSHNLEWLILVSTLKGGAFLIVTTAVVFVLLLREFDRREAMLETLRREVSEHEDTAEALRRQHGLLQRIMEAAPVGIVLTDRDGFIRYSNPHAAARSHLTDEERTRTKFDDPRFHLTDKHGAVIPVEQRIFHRTKQTLRPILDEPMCFHSSSGEHYILCSSVPLFDRAGAFDGIIVVIEDVTALERQTERLRVLHEIDAAVRSVTSLTEITATVVTHVRRLIPAFRCSVYLFDDEIETIRFLSVSTDRASAIVSDATYRIGQPLQRVVESREMYIDNDVTPATPLDPPISMLVPEGLRAYAITPLISRGDLMGALNIFFDTPGMITDEYQAIVSELAGQLASAFDKNRLIAELTGANENLRQVSWRIVQAQEGERRAIARELHDEVGQTLTGLSLALELLGRRTPNAQDEVANVLGIVADLTRRVRALSLDLRPAMLDDFGLLPALRWLFSRYTEQTGIQVRFQHSEFESRLPAAHETALFRIIQEALTNVARHANVDEVSVELRRGTDSLTAEIRDAGQGFDAAAAHRSLRSVGLVSMSERAQMLGGELIIDSEPGSGTQILARFPFPAHKADTQGGPR